MWAPAVSSGKKNKYIDTSYVEKYTHNYHPHHLKPVHPVAREINGNQGTIIQQRFAKGVGIYIVVNMVPHTTTASSVALRGSQNSSRNKQNLTISPVK